MKMDSFRNYCFLNYRMSSHPVIIKSGKAFGNRFKDEDVRDKFREVGKAAQDFGKDVKDTFKKDEGKRKAKNSDQTIDISAINSLSSSYILFGR